MSIYSTVANGVIELGSIPTNIVRLIGTVNEIGEPGGTENLPLRHYGYIIADFAQRYINWLVDDTDDYFHLTRSDVNILGFKIGMPIIAEDDVLVDGSLVLRAGTVGVGDAPLRIQAGDLLTVPEAGTIEFDGTGIYLTPTSHRRFISLASDSIIATTTATTTGSTTLWTGITNADELKAHRVYVVKGCGLYTTDAVDTATITLKLGATTIGSITTPVGAVTNGPWYLEVFLTIRTIGETGTISAFGRLDASTGSSYGVLESFVLDTTIANDVTITCTWSAVGNSLKLTQCWLAEAD
jgi:hypothetical protein